MSVLRWSRRSYRCRQHAPDRCRACCDPHRCRRARDRHDAILSRPQLPQGSARCRCFAGRDDRIGAANMRLTGAELAVILTDAGVRVIVTTPSYRGRSYLKEAHDVGASLVETIVSVPPGAAPADWALARGT